MTTDMTDKIWTAPAMERRPWPGAADERASLEAFLDFHRETLLLKCAGLTGEQLGAKSVPSSNLSLLGLLRHLAEVEMWWFRQNFDQQMGLPDLYCTEEFPDGDFDLADPANAERDYAAYLREVGLSRETAAGRDLDEEFQARKEKLTLRWVYLHMLEEYARHNGHADLLREAIDGVVGE